MGVVWTEIFFSPSHCSLLPPRRDWEDSAETARIKEERKFTFFSLFGKIFKKLSRLHAMFRSRAPLSNWAAIAMGKSWKLHRAANFPLRSFLRRTIYFYSDEYSSLWVVMLSTNFLEAFHSLFSAESGDVLVRGDDRVTASVMITFWILRGRKCKSDGDRCANFLFR